MQGVILHIVALLTLSLALILAIALGYQAGLGDKKLTILNLVLAAFLFTSGFILQVLA